MVRCCSPRGLVREWFVALCAFALLVAPFGCQWQSLLEGVTSAALGPNSTGFFVNSDTSSSLLAAGRDAGGDAFYVYGTRDAAGNLAEVESIRVVESDVSSSYLVFENGRPVYARGSDGSYVSVRYDEIEPLRLVATVTVHNATNGEDESFPVVVDLTETAAEVAALVESVTGRTLEAPTVPLDGTAKADQRSGLLATAALGLLFAVPVALAIEASVVILGQALTTVFSAAGTVVRAALLLALAPLFLVSALLNDVVIEIELIGLPEVFITLPSAPRIIFD